MLQAMQAAFSKEHWLNAAPWYARSSVGMSTYCNVGIMAKYQVTFSSRWLGGSRLLLDCVSP